MVGGHHNMRGLYYRVTALGRLRSTALEPVAMVLHCLALVTYLLRGPHIYYYLFCFLYSWGMVSVRNGFTTSWMLHHSVSRALL